MNQELTAMPDGPKLSEPDKAFDEILTYADVCRRYKLKRGTLYCWVSQGSIPHVRLGPRTVRFRRSDLEQWLAERTVGSGPQLPKDASATTARRNGQ